MKVDTFNKNARALEESGQTLALQWLNEAPATAAAEIVEAAGGEAILVINGQTQASRHDPRREALSWLQRQRPLLTPGGADRALLFGFGNPIIVEALLAQQEGLWVYEPNPEAARAAFSRFDFSAHLKTRLGLLTPWHAAEGLPKELDGAALLVHPPSQRREAAQLANLTRIISGSARHLGGLIGPLKIMVVPPLSGGSWPVAVSMARACEASGHKLLFVEWPDQLKQLERAAHQSPPPDRPRLTAKLFETTGPMAAEAAEGFQPHLVLALAQAPLDGAGLTRLRQATGAPLALWLVEDVRHVGYAAAVVPAYDALFHIQETVIEPFLKSWGLSRAWYLPLAADPHLFQPLNGGREAAGVFRAALSFMGAGYPNRRKAMGFLAEKYWPHSGRADGDFKIFGSGWSGVSRKIKNHLFDDGRRVSLPECAMIYGGGLVNLNIHSSFHSTQAFDPESAFVNPRTFEIAAAGSFQLVDPRPLMGPLFEPGREIMVAEKLEDLPQLIDHYLAHPEDAAQMGQAARQRVLREHTYGHRLSRLLSLLGWRA